jgi:glutamate synthase (NADPH/NADH) large chain
MSTEGAEPIGSMGADIPLPVLSTLAQHVANYFKQEFAQVTNPPIDPLRERVFMSLHTFIGPSIKIHNSIESKAFQIKLRSPVLTETDFGTIISEGKNYLKFHELSCLFSPDEKNGELERAINILCSECEEAVSNGARVLILSNENIGFDKAGIPSLLSVGAVHQHLINIGERKNVSIIAKGADVLETHHFATLLSFGADAVFPFLAYEIVRDYIGGKDDSNVYNYKKAVEKGLLKVMSKLGISTISSYKGAQTFEALGIHKSVVDKCFNNTVTRIGGMTFDMLAKEQIVKHKAAFSAELKELPDLGNYQWKGYGEFHLFNPQTIHLLQYSTSRGDYGLYKKFSSEINNQYKKACTLRSFFEFNTIDVQPIDISEVESADKILRRFATGAMSFGSISYEAHTTLAKAMNRIGGKSNSGEGGEDEIRYTPDENGDNMSSAIKQVASGRFGVTINYLAHANELQIKIAQGAKPGEGGQLPGHKVNDWIARVRHSTPGVGLISPPPHHDIYSIEDLAQLIFDLKNANPDARISVKLVSKAGVGIIAAGVAKAHADHILISGADGGTGASPLSSIRHAGLPWELGLSETHQTLVKNKLRDRVVIQSDGQMRTGRDLAFATLLGAEEWGVATAALVVEGCILMRKCHLNTCPVGVATQDPVLRKKFTGKVEHVVNYFHFLAQELREIMASLGIRSINEMVGRVDLLKVRENLSHWKWRNIDFDKLLYKPQNNDNLPVYKCNTQDHGIAKVLDKKLIKYASLAIKDNVSINSVFKVHSTDRAVGTMLSHFMTKTYGSEGMKEDSISFRFRGSAGQSFGAFGAKGLTMTLEGDSNDYLGKGLSGAKIIIVPDRDSKFTPSDNIIIGNVALYGATEGEVYIRGQAGDRFCVRNSGAITVVEGTGDNACEYMTGGRVVVLGKVGRNFAAGMSGGIAYIYGPTDAFFLTCNKEMVSLEKPNNYDLIDLRKIIRKHFHYTGSISALEVLSDWDQKSKNFLKVIPVEYKKVLEANEKKNLGSKNISEQVNN